MSISVLAAIVGVMVAAADTGLVGGRCIRRPGPSFIAWTTGMVALTVALLAQSIGFTTGFDPATFRVIQLAAQLVAPVVLVWGLVELVARGPAARFGARLVAAALIVVIGVVLATDPLAARPSGTAWPSAAVHYQLIPHYALIALHLTVAVGTVAAVALCAARGRGQAAQGRLVTGAAAVGAAVLSAVALRFTLPAGAAYPTLSVLSAVLVWFGMTRLDGMVPGDSRAGSGGMLTPEFPGRPRAASHAGGAHGAGAAGRNGADGAEHEARGRARRITLLSKPGCHLCEGARTVIARVAADLGVGWEERDITASSQDLAEYWDKIPVTLVDGVQHDFWRVSEDRLRAALRH